MTFPLLFPQAFLFIPQWFRYFGVYDVPGVPVVLLVMAAGKDTIPAGTTFHSHPEQRAAHDPSGSIDCFGDICERQLRKKSCYSWLQFTAPVGASPLEIGVCNQ